MVVDRDMGGEDDDEIIKAEYLECWNAALRSERGKDDTCDIYGSSCMYWNGQECIWTFSKEYCKHRLARWKE
jgi:hypothetical protein